MSMRRLTDSRLVGGNQVDSHYCPSCLENMPSAEAKLKKNRWARGAHIVSKAGHCWLCNFPISLPHQMMLMKVINIHSWLCVLYCSAGVQIVLTARVACTRCLPEPPTSQRLCLTIPPRRPWRRLTTWPAASVAGPPGMWEWLTNPLVGADVNNMEVSMWP